MKWHPSRWLKDPLGRRLALSFCIYLACTAVYFACAQPARLFEHTPFNHYALLADSWLHHRLDLGHPPPSYTQNNDFAEYHGHFYVSFPPFPAVLLLPLAKIAEKPENLRDGQVWLWLAGAGPAVLFLALEKLRRAGYSDKSERQNVALAALFAFGTVYFFTAEQGTVWFAAHVVAVLLGALYLLFAIDADRPLLAGIAVGLTYVTRPPMVFSALFFALEAVRRSAGGTLPSEGSLGERLRATLRALDVRALAARLALFALPLAVVWGVTSWHNYARFGSIWTFGHELLTVGWRGRIDKWGLDSYHYLARNLGIVLTSLPYLTHVPAKVQINGHGLALWLTTPVYLWLLWPRRTGWLWWCLWATVACVALPDLLYQNSGWLQFGYRFSNDFSLFLFALLAIGGFRFGRAFWAAALFGVAVNAFGAITFDRPQFAKFYFIDGSQQIIYQPD